MDARRLLAAALLLAAILPPRAPAADPLPPPRSISVERLGRTPDVVIVDVRLPEHWQESDRQIAGARRGSPDAVERWSRGLAKADVTAVYCDCPGEATSRRVALELSRLGFSKVYVLEGGWSRWSAAGCPVEPRAPEATP